jgi:hypothetical protein|tara:strand:- start:1562 stop:3670 length:2109 start_codon:yes stop_codon:yes gene_type:complete
MDANERVIGLGDDTAEAARQAVRAEAEADRAEAQADLAATHANTAGNYAETARSLVGGAVYEDTTAGLAATVDGEFFVVANDTEHALYRNDSSSAVFVRDLAPDNYVTPEMFGEVGAGADDNALFTAAVASGKPVRAMGSTYQLNPMEFTSAVDIEFGSQTEIQNLQASGPKKATITVKGGVTGPLVTVSSFDLINAGGTVTALTIGQLSRIINVADASSFAAGDVVRISENDPATTSTRKGTAGAETQDRNYREFATIDSIAGNKITLREFVRWPYTAAKSLKVQKVNFVENPRIVGGKWTGGIGGGGALAFEFCRHGKLCDDIHVEGNSEADRFGGASVTVRDCWEVERGSIYAKWCLFTALTERNQASIFGRIRGKRTQNGGSIQSGDILSNFAEIVQDAPGDDNGDGIGVSNGFRGNTVGSFIMSGANCYGMWLRQGCDDNTFVSFTSINGITLGIQVYGNRNTFSNVHIRGHASGGLLLAGDDNQAHVDIEVQGQAVGLGPSSRGNRVTGRAISTGVGVTSFDLTVSTGVTDSYVDIQSGPRGISYAAGVLPHASNTFFLRGPNPHVVNTLRTDRGYQWSGYVTVTGGAKILEVPERKPDGTWGTNGLYEIQPTAGDAANVYRIRLQLSSTLADVRSEYEVISRQGAFTIRTIHEGAGTYAAFAPKLRAATGTSGPTLEIYRTETGAAPTIVYVEKY